jgi:hypothetical protein
MIFINLFVVCLLYIYSLLLLSLRADTFKFGITYEGFIRSFKLLVVLFLMLTLILMLILVLMLILILMLMLIELILFFDEIGVEQVNEEIFHSFIIICGANTRLKEDFVVGMQGITRKLPSNENAREMMTDHLDGCNLSLS